MKKLLLSLMLILLSGLAVHSATGSEKAGEDGAKATIVAYINANNFPDQNFRSYLLSRYPNGYITDDDVNACTSIIVTNKNISSLTGLEYFTKLTYLSCGNNNLTSLPELPSSIKTVYAISNKFTTLTIRGMSKLTSLDVMNNTLLTTLQCDNNALTTLKVSGCSAMTTLSCQNNQLASLGTLPTSLKQLSCYNNALTMLDIGGCIVMTTIECHGNNLTSLGTLPNSLTYLSCQNNQLTSLPTLPSGLTYFYCNNNQLTSLPTLPGALTSFNCKNNRLNSLSVTGLTNLAQLYCDGNNLSSLSVEGCSRLNRLDCYNNQIRGSGMSTLVNSLRTIPEGSQGTFRVTYDVTDGNFFTNVNMSDTREKRWRPYRYENGNWVEIVDINYDVNRDGVLDPEDANKLVLNFFSFTFDSNVDADLNCDDHVDSGDLVVLLSYLKTNPMNMDVTPYKGLVDVTGDGKINSRDLNEILTFVEYPRYGWECTDSKDVNGDGLCDWWDYFIVYFCIENGWTSIRGDVNCDRSVNVADVNLLISVILAIDSFDDYPNADLNADNAVNISDLNLLINILLGK